LTACYLRTKSGESLLVVGVNGATSTTSWGSSATGCTSASTGTSGASLTTSSTSSSTPSPVSTSSTSTSSITRGCSSRGGELTIELDEDLLLLSGGSGLGGLLLAGEEVIDTFPPELGSLDSLVVDLSTFLLAESRVLSSGSLGEVFVVRLGNLLLLFLDRRSWGYSSLTLGGSPSSISLFSGRSLRSVLLILGILLTLLFGVELGLAIVSSPSVLDLLLRVGEGAALSLELSSFTGVVGGSGLAGLTTSGRVAAGCGVPDGPVLSWTLGVGVGALVRFLGSRDSLAVKSSGVLESFLDVSACGASVPLFTLRPSTSGTSSSSVGVSSRGSSGDSSLGSGGGLSFGLSGRLGWGRRRRRLSVVLELALKCAMWPDELTT